MTHAFLVLLAAIVLGALLGNLHGPRPQLPTALPFTAIFRPGETITYTFTQPTQIRLFLRLARKEYEQVVLDGLALRGLRDQYRDYAQDKRVRTIHHPYTYHQLRTRFGLTDKQIAGGAWVPVMFHTKATAKFAFSKDPA